MNYSRPSPQQQQNQNQQQKGKQSGSNNNNNNNNIMKISSSKQKNTKSKPKSPTPEIAIPEPPTGNIQFLTRPQKSNSTTMMNNSTYNDNDDNSNIKDSSVPVATFPFDYVPQLIINESPPSPEIEEKSSPPPSQHSPQRKKTFKPKPCDLQYQNTSNYFKMVKMSCDVSEYGN